MVRKGSPVRVRKRAYRFRCPPCCFGWLTRATRSHAMKSTVARRRPASGVVLCGRLTWGVQRRCGTPQDTLALEPESGANTSCRCHNLLRRAPPGKQEPTFDNQEEQPGAHDRDAA